MHVRGAILYDVHYASQFSMLIDMHMKNVYSNFQISKAFQYTNGKYFYNGGQVRHVTDMRALSTLGIGMLFGF